MTDKRHTRGNWMAFPWQLKGISVKTVGHICVNWKSSRDSWRAYLWQLKGISVTAEGHIRDNWRAYPWQLKGISVTTEGHIRDNWSAYPWQLKGISLTTEGNTGDTWRSYLRQDEEHPISSILGTACPQTPHPYRIFHYWIPTLLTLFQSWQW